MTKSVKQGDENIAQIMKKASRIYKSIYKKKTKEMT